VGDMTNYIELNPPVATGTKKLVKIPLCPHLIKGVSMVDLHDLPFLNFHHQNPQVLGQL